MKHFKSVGEFKLVLQSRNPQFGSKSVFFVLCDIEIWPWKTLGRLFYSTPSFVHHFKVICELNLRYSPVTPNSCQNKQIFVLCDLEFWQMTLKNNKAPLLCCFKLCASFHSHQWFKTGVTVRKCQIWVKSDFFVQWDLEIWQMTLKNYRAPLLLYVKRCASFQSHLWIQTWVTVRKHPIQVKIGKFLSCVTLKFDRWPWKTIGHLFYAALSFVHHFIAISNLKLGLQSGNAKFGSKSMIFCPVWPWNFTDDLGKR